MKKHGLNEEIASRLCYLPPAYPHTARAIFGELRSQLTAELRRPMTYRRLAKLMGKSKSAVHRWFEFSAHPQVIALFCMLERLSPTGRHAFLAAHCRVNPTLAHPRLAHAPANISKIMELLRQPAALTLVSGGTESARTFLATAIGAAHWGSTVNSPSIAGIDLHRPANFVPVPGLLYVDGTQEPKRVRQLVAERLPRILTSAASLVILNSVWNWVPELRRDILACAGHKHIVLVEAGTPDLAMVKKSVRSPVHVVTLSTSKLVRDGIRITCRRVKSAKPQ